MSQAPRFGLGTWSYTAEGAPGFEEVCGRVSALGYDGIELDGGPKWFHPARYPGVEQRRRLREQIQAYGLAPSAYNPAFYDHDICARDAGARRAYLEAMEEAVRFAADCDIGVVRLDTAQAPPGPDGRIEAVVEAWTQAAALAGDAGIRLAWEFEPGFMLNSPSEVLAVVGAIDHPAFGVLFDTCHAHMVAEVGARQAEHETLAGGAAELARRLDGRISLVHVIDSDGTLHDDFTSTHAPIGTGDVDFPTVLGACLEAGYDGPWFSVDLCFWPHPERHEAPCLEATRALVGGLPVGGGA